MDMTPAYWQKAHAIAQELAGDVDRNELGKVVSYFRQTQDRAKLFQLLERLPNSNYIRSQQTKGYFTRMGQSLRRHLRDVTDPKAIVWIISWAFRLMSYYQVTAQPSREPHPGQRGPAKTAPKSRPEQSRTPGDWRDDLGQLRDRWKKALALSFREVKAHVAGRCRVLGWGNRSAPEPGLLR